MVLCHVQATGALPAEHARQLIIWSSALVDAASDCLPSGSPCFPAQPAHVASCAAAACAMHGGACAAACAVCDCCMCTALALPLHAQWAGLPVQCAAAGAACAVCCCSLPHLPAAHCCRCCCMCSVMLLLLHARCIGLPATLVLTFSTVPCVATAAAACTMQGATCAVNC